MHIADNLIALPQHPDELPWPTQNWQSGSTEHPAATSLMERAFSLSDTDPLGVTHAVLVVQNGQIVLEQYAKDKSATHTYPSWSMAKSITQALVGIAVGDGRLDIDERIPVPEWSSPDDPRHHLTWDQLLRMSSGLDWVEEYEIGQTSDVIEMLFSGKHHDYGGYAASKPLIHPAGSHWYYSSGTTNIIARALQVRLGLSGDTMKEFMFDRLFTPIGMMSPVPKFDPSGVFVGSSFCYSTARDFARFGYLYLRDGVWDGKRILPEGWVDYARTPTPQPEHEELGYGAHWWLGMCGETSFSANGFQGQYTIIVPEDDLIIVRHGVSEGDAGKEAVQSWLAELAACFRT